MPRLLPLVASLLLACTLLSAQAEVQVLTSIKPLQLIAAAIQDGAGQPAVLLPPGASPHHYALRPSDLRQVREANLVYWIGPDLETFLPAVLKDRQGPSLAVQELPGLHLRRFGEEHADAHDDEHEHEHEHAHAHGDEQGGEPEYAHDHDHRPGSLDAHLWLSPANARVIATRLAADLSQADPANAQRYAANLKTFETELAAKDQALRAQLAPLAGKPYFVFHEAFDYFEEAYGLGHRGVFALGADVQPGARHVAAMREELKAAGPTCVFTEPPLQPKIATTLSSGLPVTLVELDPLGARIAADRQGYTTLLQRVADTLGGCLGKLP
ncbi:zinc ABC transporter substrate-binding protein ZnuA [Pseudomonas sp. EpS/L25]|uniref:zinc ABC transporter substrate-binding protein ZnuA n=1 Tax=Pseudomonas sp. EpS/L25 TaxID=1749078 RepID=UPI0007443152|nr:zinc ABC transporter substrate-binding protein ZnuA [Pseudomonas sp. EpS/L25]KUM42839.1 ABC transporter substrate-binding protein [Pseudomonas sp. EpS/L25]